MRLFERDVTFLHSISTFAKSLAVEYICAAGAAQPQATLGASDPSEVYPIARSPLKELRERNQRQSMHRNTSSYGRRKSKSHSLGGMLGMMHACRVMRR